MKLSRGNSEQASEPVILAVDTSSLCAGYALARAGSVLASLTVEGITPHSQTFFEHLSVILRLAQLELNQIDALAVITGPGSFTGLRVGLAAVKGLAFSLRKPVTGMSAFDLLALSTGLSWKVLSIINAGRGEVYAGLRELDGQGVFAQTAADQAGKVSSVLQSLLPLIGSASLVLTGAGAMHYQAEIAEFAQRLGLPLQITPLMDPHFDGWQVKTTIPPLAIELACRASLCPDAKAGTEVQAYYLRPADAELKTKDKDVAVR